MASERRPTVVGLTCHSVSTVIDRPRPSDGKAIAIRPPRLFSAEGLGVVELSVSPSSQFSPKTSFGFDTDPPRACSVKRAW